MSISKGLEKKILKKQIRAQHIITADTQIECRNEPTESLAICNAGLSTGLQLETLLNEATKFGSVRSCVMLPGKSYCFLQASTVNDARLIFEAMHARSTLAQHAGVLYLSYCERVPAVSSTWDTAMPAGLVLIENFVDADEERQLLASIDTTAAATTSLKHRHVQHFGYEFQYGTNTVDSSQPLLDRPIPSECTRLWSRLQAHTDGDAAEPFRPDQLTVNAYAPGHGIPSHVDTHSPFTDTIAALSLGSDVVMEFRRPATGAHRSVLLPARSLLLMRGESRYGWTHGITPRSMDVVPRDAADGGGGGLTVRRRQETRVSFTFRQLRTGPCVCEYPDLCDTAKLSTNTASVEHTKPSAADLELANVHRVYDTIAGHFSETRHSPWPRVLEFVNGLATGNAAVLADIGCGNGKYLVANGGGRWVKLGGDRSAGLLEVCRARGLNVFRCDCLQVPLRDGCADGCICIAVVHHLATEERRLQALREMARILCPGGRALVYVWAKNQAKDDRQSSYLRQNKRNRCPVGQGDVDAQVENHKTPLSDDPVQYVAGLPVHTNRTQFAAQDMLVPWKLKSSSASATGQPSSETQQFLRYYHVFEEGELEALISRVEGVRVVNSYYDQGNWCVVFERMTE